jgi:hypothetical protein
MHVSLKRQLAIGTAVLAAAAFGGGAYAATQDSGVNLRQVFLNDVAERSNVTLGDIGPRRPAGPLAAAAKYLGLSGKQLIGQLGSGKSPAQIAAARGKPVSGLKDAMVAAVKADLDKALAATLLTSAQEQRILGRISASIDNVISRTVSEPRLGPGGAAQTY